MILVVDDDDDVRSTVTSMLDVLAYPHQEALDGAEALGLLRRSSFSLVILDYLMPRKNGVEVIRELRAAGSTIPAVLITAVNDTRLEEDLGVPVLVKPFLIADLIDVIERATGAGA